MKCTTVIILSQSGAGRESLKNACNFDTHMPFKNTDKQATKKQQRSLLQLKPAG